MFEQSISNVLRILAVAAGMSFSALSVAKADTGEGDSALRAALHDPQLIDQQRGRSADQHLIGDPSLGYAKRQRANPPASTYTRYRP